MVKILVVTTPIRPKPTYFPPIGSLSLIKYLRKSGFEDVHFYNIDGNRPDYAEVQETIRRIKPDILGISAVVSTAYDYTKKLADDFKESNPDGLAVVGGNMAASANVLLKKSGTDICVLGEGEITFAKIAERAETTRRASDYHDIPGLMILDGEGGLINTGYELALPGAEIWDYDLEDLEQSSDKDLFFFPAFDEAGKGVAWYDHDPRSHEPHRRNKRVGMIDCAKGCVARCTFCHRWDKGIRQIPVDRVMAQLERQIERYDVGFVMANAETFGADKRWLDEFCERIKDYDILWRAPGVRANSLDESWVSRLKEAGCVEIASGNETGSKKMLQIMEKKVDLKDNFNLVTWTAQAGISAPVQLVIGMPGENNQTIDETIKFCQFALSQTPDQNPNNLSINYAQALPGTPLYEYARSRALIKTDLEGEEEYLKAISDRDAHDEITTLNFTDNPTLSCRAWRPRITIGVNYHYVKTFGIGRYYEILSGSFAEFQAPADDSGYYANPKRLMEQGDDSNANRQTRPAKPSIPGILALLARGKFGLAMIAHPVFFYRIRWFVPLLVLLKEAKEVGLGSALGLSLNYLGAKLAKPFAPKSFAHAYKSLRKIVDEDMGALPGDAIEMKPLRKGR